MQVVTAVYLGYQDKYKSYQVELEKIFESKN